MKLKQQLEPTVVEEEYNLIVEALKKTSFNQTKAAKLLGISRKTIYLKIKKYEAIQAEKQKVA